MTCRHNVGDPDCTVQYPKYIPETPTTPDASNYTIEKMQRVETKHVVLQVKYPNCRNCSYEGLKTLVFLNVTEIDIVCWKKIDPHFRDPKNLKIKTEAPSPIARFPGTDEGFEDAIMYLREKEACTPPEPEPENSTESRRSAYSLEMA